MFKFPRGLIHAGDTSAPEEGVGGGVKPLVTKMEITVVAAPEQQCVYKQNLSSLIPSSLQSL